MLVINNINCVDIDGSATKSKYNNSSPIILINFLDFSKSKCCFSTFVIEFLSDILRRLLLLRNATWKKAEKCLESNARFPLAEKELASKVFALFFWIENSQVDLIYWCCLNSTEDKQIFRWRTISLQVKIQPKAFY